MQASDELIVATLDAKNALEGFSYDTQSKLQYDFSDWTPFATEEEKTALLSAVDEALSWLYGEGDSAEKEQYKSKLSALQLLSAPLELRRNETESRGPATELFWQAVGHYKAFVASTDEKYAHIDAEKRQKVTDKINESEDWLAKMKERQETLPSNADPVLLTSEIEQRVSALKRLADPIIATPKPAPPKEEPKKEEAEVPKESDAMDTAEKPESTTEGTPDLPTPAEEGKIEEVPPTTDSMDVD